MKAGVSEGTFRVAWLGEVAPRCEHFGAGVEEAMSAAEEL